MSVGTGSIKRAAKAAVKETAAAEAEALKKEGTADKTAAKAKAKKEPAREKEKKETYGVGDPLPVYLL